MGYCGVQALALAPRLKSERLREVSLQSLPLPKKTNKTSLQLHELLQLQTLRHVVHCPQGLWRFSYAVQVATTSYLPSEGVVCRRRKMLD